MQLLVVFVVTVIGFECNSVTVNEGDGSATPTVSVLMGELAITD